MFGSQVVSCLESSRNSLPYVRGRSYLAMIEAHARYALRFAEEGRSAAESPAAAKLAASCTGDTPRQGSGRNPKQALPELAPPVAVNSGRTCWERREVAEEGLLTGLKSLKRRFSAVRSGSAPKTSPPASLARQHSAPTATGKSPLP